MAAAAAAAAATSLPVALAGSSAGHSLAAGLAPAAAFMPLGLPGQGGNVAPIAAASTAPVGGDAGSSAITSSPRQAAALLSAAATAVAASAASASRKAQKSRRKQRAAAVVRFCNSADADDTSTPNSAAITTLHEEALLAPAWEKALQGGGTDVFSEPSILKTMVDEIVDAPGDEKIRGVRFERISAQAGGDIMLWVPGVDFTGIFAFPQFRGLSKDYELWRCFVGSEDRTPFVQLADTLVAWLRPKLKEGRRVVLAGESFGGLLALAVALRLGDELSGLVLVNPATAFSRSIWPLLGRIVSAIPLGDGATGKPPAPFQARSTAELLEEIQKDAINNPYAYLGSTALIAGVADGSQLGRVLSRSITSLLDEQTQNGQSAGPSPFLADFLRYPLEIAKLLPPNTVKFRLRRWLRDGCEQVESELRAGPSKKRQLPPALLVASDEDSFIPSQSEGERLFPKLRARCKNGAKLVKLPDSGHAPLDARLDLSALIRDSAIGSPPAKIDYVTDWSPPTLQQLESGSKNIENIGQVFSPVFLSKDWMLGSRRFGLSGVPDPKEIGRPVLLVGNHQFFALDLGCLVREFLLEKGYAPRGLAHPINFPEVQRDLAKPAEPPSSPPGLLEALGLPFEIRAAVRATEDALQNFFSGDDGKEPQQGTEAKEDKDGEDKELGISENFGVGGNFAEWGAVPVTPRNFYAMMKRNDAMLLFPGGAREAVHGAGEAYQLFWPSKTDFVRVAARFNAVVVPFGAVGSADNFVFLPRSWGPLEPLRAVLPPPLGGAGAGQGINTALMTSGQQGGAFGSRSESLTTPPSSSAFVPAPVPASQDTPGFGDRFYLSFGQPVDLRGLDPKDRESCDKVYAKIKHAVQGEIDWLLDARKQDPYRNFLRRQLWERTANAETTMRYVKAGPNKGGIIRSYGRRAPSFDLEEVGTPAEPMALSEGAEQA